MRTVIAALVVVGLAVGVFLMWPRPDEEAPPGAEATPSTTSPAPTSTSTPPPTATSSTDAGSHVVKTVEEAEAILRELWFGWFEGIYDQDEDRIREVVGNPDLVDSAIDQFGVMEFDRAPTASELRISGTETLRSDPRCLAVWASVDATFRSGSIQGVHVFRWMDQWLLINTWPMREDLWEADCDVRLDSP